MKTMQRFTISAAAAVMLLGLEARAGMSTQDRNAAIGAVDGRRSTSRGMRGRSPRVRAIR